MKVSLFLAALALIASLFTTSAAEARRHRPAPQYHSTDAFETSLFGWSAPRPSKTATRRTSRSSDSDVRGSNARPGQWCGWYMRQRHGGGPEMNIAWNWRNYGSASSPHVGAIVVWRHHVGEITGQTASGQWIVRSGNDGGRVRERVRSISGAVVRA